MMTPPRRAAGLLALAPLALLSTASAQVEGQQTDFDNATSIPANAIVAESVSPVGDIDTFIFTVDNPSTLTAYTTGGLDTFGCLFNGGGSLLSMSSTGGDDGNFRLETTIQPGSYFVQVSSWVRRDTGDYELRLEVDSGGGGIDWTTHSKFTAPSIEINSEINEEISENGAVNSRRLSLIEPQTVTISSRGDLDTFGSLLDQNGDEIASDDNSGSGSNFRFETTVPAGNYYCVVRATSPEDSGSYTLNVESSEPTDANLSIDDIEFGRAEIGTQTVRQVAIENLGNVTVDVTSLDLPVGYEASFAESIPPRTRRHIEVAFLPAAPIQYSGQLVASVGGGAAISSAAISGRGSSATDPAMGDEFHNATFVTGDASVSLRVGSSTKTPPLVRYDADRDLTLDISGLPTGTVNLRSADGALISSADSETGSIALSEGTYYLQFVGDGGTHDIEFTTGSLQPFAVQTIQRAGDAGRDIKLAFNSTAGRQYKIEVNDNTGSDWLQIDLLAGTGRSLQCIETGALDANDTRVFRVTEVAE